MKHQTPSTRKPQQPKAVSAGDCSVSHKHGKFSEVPKYMGQPGRRILPFWRCSESSAELPESTRGRRGIFERRLSQKIYRRARAEIVDGLAARWLSGNGNVLKLTKPYSMIVMKYENVVRT